MFKSYSLATAPKAGFFYLRNTLTSASVVPKLVPVIVMDPFKMGEAEEGLIPVTEMSRPAS